MSKIVTAFTFRERGLNSAIICNTPIVRLLFCPNRIRSHHYYQIFKLIAFIQKFVSSKTKVPKVPCTKVKSTLVHIKYKSIPWRTIACSCCLRNIPSRCHLLTNLHFIYCVWTLSSQVELKAHGRVGSEVWVPPGSSGGLAGRLYRHAPTHYGTVCYLQHRTVLAPFLLFYHKFDHTMLCDVSDIFVLFCFVEHSVASHIRTFHSYIRTKFILKNG